MKKKRSQVFLADEHNITFCRGHPRYSYNRSPFSTASLLLHNFNYTISHLQLSEIYNSKKAFSDGSTTTYDVGLWQRTKYTYTEYSNFSFQIPSLLFGLITHHELICCWELHTNTNDGGYLLLLFLFHFLLCCSFEGFYPETEEETSTLNDGGLEAKMAIAARIL